LLEFLDRVAAFMKIFRLFSVIVTFGDVIKYGLSKVLKSKEGGNRRVGEAS
jgi:hypothetical protein